MSFFDRDALEKFIITDEQVKILNKGICPTCGAIGLKDAQIGNVVFKPCDCGKVWILRVLSDNPESGLLSPFLQKELGAHYSGEENFKKMYMCTFPAEDDLKKEWIAKFARYLGWQPDELPQDVLALGIRQYDAKNGLSHAIDVVKRQLRLPPYHDA